MKINFLAIAAAILYSTQALALFGATPPAYCYPAMHAREQHDLPGAGYWMQFGGDRYLTYTSVGGTNSQMYDTKARRSVAITSDNYDPAPLAEGDVYIQPEPLRFYRMKDGIAEGNAAKPLYTDEKNVGNYQSVGLLGSDGNTRKLRVLVGSEAKVQDYDLRKNGDSYTVTAKSSHPQPICQNLLGRNEKAEGNNDLGNQIPILSRDGSMIAVKNPSDQTMDIYKLQMPRGNCTLFRNIKSMTDKVSFSFDGKKILYVVKDDKNGFGRLMEYDIAAKKSTLLSGPDENVLYQGYKPDGTIMYSREAGGGNENSPSQLMMIDPGSVPDKDSKLADKFRAIGKIWGASCKRYVDDDSATVVGSRMTKEMCQQLTAAQSASGGSVEAMSSCGQGATSGGSSISR